MHKIGYDIIRIQGQSGKTLHSKELKYYITKTGNYYLPKFAHGDIIVNDIINDKIYDYNVYKIAKKYIKKGTVVIDVGSNFGQLAIQYSRLVGENGKVYAFEADEYIFKILLKNIAANNCKNIIPINKAVYKNSIDKLFFPLQDFKINTTYGSFGIDYLNNTGRPVDSISIDSLNINELISFMKVDIQGGDLYALQGAINTIKKYKFPIIFEYEYALENQLKLKFQEYVDFINILDYKFENVINASNYLITYKNENTNN